MSIYRWWARRTIAVNGAILDAVGIDDHRRLLVSDPFAGGGVIPLAAVSRGHRAYAQELNPWAAHGLRAMLDLPTPERIKDAVAKLEIELQELLDQAYLTELSSGEPGQVSHTFRVASALCSACGVRQRLFPHALVSLCRRKERGQPEAFLACPHGHIFEGRTGTKVSCPHCSVKTDPTAVYTKGRWIACGECGHRDRMETRATAGEWQWEAVLIERAGGSQRELALPTARELGQADPKHWSPERTLGPIPAGQETPVLLRHGFSTWDEIYPARQRVVTEKLLEATEQFDDDVAAALRLAVIGTTEMAGLASRWDRWYLKSYETMAAHRFNFTTFAAEPNVWGTKASGRGTFTRRIRSFVKAAEWLTEHAGDLRVEGPIPASSRRTAMRRDVDVRVAHGSSERAVLPVNSVNLVLTDPPYHDDVQYGELSLPLRAWAGLPVETLNGEAVANGATGANSDFAEYADLLRRIFAEAQRTLDADGHVIFSYANREPRAWAALFGALDEAGLRACGYAVLHSENETDHAKRNVRSCTMDFILDLVDSSRSVENIWCPEEMPNSDEGDFLTAVGHWFSRIGELPKGWEDELISDLSATGFLSK